MKIIKNNNLTSNFSINTIAISFDGHVLAYGDGNKNITLVSNRKLIEYYKNQKGQKDINSKFYVIPADQNLNKTILNFHMDSINALVFAKRYLYILVSASSDKSVMVTYLNHDLSQKLKKLINLNAEVTDVQLSLNDQVLLFSLMDNSIVLYHTHFDSMGTPEAITTVNIHNNIITSLALDNSYIENKNICRYASYADDGRLIISETNFESRNLVKNSISRDYSEFINPKNKINSIQKKIDWSVDGNWIASVNYHYIKNHKVYHLKLVDYKNLGNTQILIGHESAIVVAKFSLCKYTDKQGKSFSILATGDKSGNLILWKITGNSFKVLAEINNLSESNITNLCWSPFGEYLYICNSNGSIYIIELNDFSLIEPSFYHIEISKLTNNEKKNLKNNVNPNNHPNDLKIVYSTNSNLQQNGYSTPFNDVNIAKGNQNPDDKKLSGIGRYGLNNLNNSNGGGIYTGNYYYNDSQNQNISGNYSNNFIPNENKHFHENDNCGTCRILRFDSIQTKEVNIKLDLADDFSASFVWENKINSYNSYIKLIINNKILYYNNLNGKFIKQFVCNNFVYVFYDTDNLIHISSLLNTSILNNLHYGDVSYIRLFGNFVLIVSSGNKFTIINAYTKKKYLDEYIDVKLDSHSTISDVKFIELDKIFIYLNQYNFIKKSFVRQIFLFNTEFKLLMMIDDNQEIEQMINTKIIENNKIKSIYSDILSQINLIQPLFENLLSIDCSEEELRSRIKITDEIKDYEEKLSFARLLSQKDEFFKILRNYMFFLVKYKINFKILDLTMDILKFNSEFYFYIKDETDILIANLLREIFVEDPNVNLEIKNYVICVAQDN